MAAQNTELLDMSSACLGRNIEAFLGCRGGVGWVTLVLFAKVVAAGHGLLDSGFWVGGASLAVLAADDDGSLQALRVIGFFEGSCLFACLVNFFFFAVGPRNADRNSFLSESLRSARASGF